MKLEKEVGVRIPALVGFPPSPSRATGFVARTLPRRAMETVAVSLCATRVACDHPLAFSREVVSEE
uniref:Uncharacterized protein n=1 Tax=Timema genevievae TaxID=629358 RepID=A0A7R9PSB1_TIMGE|nr:unnamed protein product [Timema genevievae]